MALGNALPGFTDWFVATGPTMWSGPDEIITELTQVNYSQRFFMDGSMAQNMQGGSKIQDQIILDGDYNWGPHFPGKVQEFNQVNVLTNHEAPWRMEMGNMSWTEAEVDLQGPSSMSASARFQTFKRIRATKKLNMMTGISNGIEARIWRAPVYAHMELATSSAAVDGMHYSIPCFITEFNNAQHGTKNGLFPGWATLQQIDPDQKPGWDNRRFKYTSAGKVKSTHDSSPNDLNRALSAARRNTKAAALPRGAGGATQAFEAPSFIACSEYGMWLYEQNLEAGNERFRTQGRADGHYGGLSFDGISLEYFESLNDAALYPDNTSGSATAALKTEATADHKGPRYYLINRGAIKMWFHTDHFFKTKAPYFLPEQPDVWVSVTDLWSNFFCRSRRRNAIVYPSADQLDYAV